MAVVGSSQRGTPEPYLFYLSALSPQQLAVCSELAQLGSLKTALDQRTHDSKPTDAVATSHDYWGYRRYRHGESRDNVASGLDYVSKSVEWLSFHVDARRGLGVLRLRAGDGTAAERLASTTTNLRFGPLNSIDGNTWELSVALVGNQSIGEHVFYIMSLFGFGIYL